MRPRLYVTCPSYAINNPRDRAGRLKPAQLWADAFGWEVVPSPLLAHYHAPNSWLPVEDRAEDLRVALNHEIVWAARGGYAAIELVPALLAATPAKPPLLLGYSDITVLHACWAKRAWGPTLYGTFADQTADSRQAASLSAYLRGEQYRCDRATEPAVWVLRPGAVRAPIFAACLVVLANLCGTPAMPTLAGQILAIEDTDERPYAIDFALHQLHLAGALDRIVGLLGGSFYHTPQADYGGPSVDDILRIWAERLAVPALSRLPFGHMDDPMVVPIGVPAELDAAADGRWSLVWRAGV